MTTLTRGASSATRSTHRLITPITSSHSPSTFVNIAFVSFGSPLARTIRTASATDSLTESPVPSGVMEKAAIIPTSSHERRATGSAPAPGRVRADGRAAGEQEVGLVGPLVEELLGD